MYIEKKILSKRFIYNEHKLNQNIKAKNVLKILNSNLNHRQKLEFCSNCESKKFYQFSETERNGLPINFLICVNCGLIISREYFSKNFAIRYYKEIYNKFKSNKSTKDLFKIRTLPESYSYIRFNFVKDNLKLFFKLSLTKLNLIYE